MGEKLIQYSQASLQDFADCPRRFYYRYQAHLSWPAVESEPVVEAERLMQAGAQFHRLVRQFLTEVPVEKLESADYLKDDLQVWWQNFLATDFEVDGAKLFPEKVISVQLGEARLVGKFDLVALFPDGRVVIYDWKTSKHQPQRSSLSSRWQTILYPYLMAVGGEILNEGTPIKGDQITMVYWYANFPGQPIKFQYSAEDMKSDEKAILAMIGDIESRSEKEEFQLAIDEKRCKYCVYRSLCDRGTAAGEELEIEFESDTEFELDFDQIQEIEF